jgi:hypothetical protein
MAKRIVSVTTITPTATADTTNLVDATYPFIAQGGSSTQRTNIIELYVGGQAGASTPTFMLLSRDSQVGSGANSNGAGQTDAAADAATAALAAAVLTGNTNATNKPQRSSTLHLLNLSFNAFGGIVRWVAAPGEEINIVGSGASLGEVSFSAFTGGTPGALGAHMIYETL